MVGKSSCSDHFCPAPSTYSALNGLVAELSRAVAEKFIFNLPSQITFGAASAAVAKLVRKRIAGIIFSYYYYVAGERRNEES